MALAPWHNMFLSELVEHFDDWQFLKSKRHFRKRFPACTWFLYPCFINHVSDFDVTVQVGVEHLAGKKRICIVGAELGNILGTGQYRWSVSSEPDIATAANGLHALFIEVGLPYLECFSQLDEILRVFRTEPQHAWLLNPLAVKDPVAEADAIEARSKMV